jgi:hypothetical protein
MHKIKLLLYNLNVIVISNKLQFSNYCNICLVTFTFALISFYGSATTYYVSSSGNDANSGTSEDSPWRSLEKVNKFFKFNPGDQVLFRRGDEWVGTLKVNVSGTSKHSIVYNAYGTGDKPKFYGSEKITGWTLHSGNIYKANVKKTDIKQLFLNGKRMKIARYPDEGYFPITAANSTTQFASTNMDDGIDYAGATCIIRSNSYTMYARKVSSSSAQTINLASAPVYSFDVGRGFFLVNKLTFLTQANEWYYDNTTNILYFWTPNGDSPANYEVRTSIFDFGVVISNKNYVTVNNLDILHSGINGVLVTSCDYVTIDNNNIISPDLIGVNVDNRSSNVTMNNNYIFQANGGGIRSISPYCTISNNTIEDTGLLENINKATYATDDNFGTAIYSRSSNPTIEYNRIINCGYCGINWNGVNGNIRYNYINGACQTLDDGGGIYTYTGNTYPDNSLAVGSVVENNIVLNVFGQYLGLGTRTYGIGYGIYLDGGTKGVTVINNTVAGAAGAMLINKGGINVVDGNTFMDANLLLRVNKEFEVSEVKNNIFYQTDRLGTYVWWGANTYQRIVYQENGANIIFDNNTYIAHYNTTKVFSPYDSFEAWKLSNGQDSHSTFNGTPLATGEKEELFYNDDKQPKTFKLGKSIFRDIYGKMVKDTFTLLPFTSKILIGNNFENINQRPAVLDQSFNVVSPRITTDFIGQVVANDANYRTNKLFIPWSWGKKI